MCENLGNSGGQGGVNFGGRFWKIQRGRGEVIWQISSVGVVWIFSGNTQYWSSTSLGLNEACIQINAVYGAGRRGGQRVIKHRSQATGYKCM